MKREPDRTIAVVIAREDVEAMDTSFPRDVFSRLLASPETIRGHQSRVDVAFDGYNEVRDELFEIPAVREYVAELDREFPYWLYFLSRQHGGLQCIARCFLLPFLTERAQAERHPKQLAQLIEQRWGPALNHICAACGHTEAEADALLMSAMLYFRDGPERVG
jgi:hypothetical protein